MYKISDKVSVVVPIYNTNANMLHQCIHSIVTQTYKNIEVLLINDGSTDIKTILAIKEWLDKDLRIKCYNKNNGGVSSARNCGITHADGKYITFVDSDDWLHPLMIETMLEKMVQHNVSMVTCANYEVTNRKIIVDSFFKRNKYFTNKKNIAEMMICFIEFRNTFCKYLHSAWGFLVETSFMRKVQYCSSITLGEDLEWASRAYYDMKSLYYIAKPLYFYRCSVGSMNHSGSYLQWIPALEKVYFNLRESTLLLNYYWHCSMLELRLLTKASFNEVVEMANCRPFRHSIRG